MAVMNTAHTNNGISLIVILKDRMLISVVMKLRAPKQMRLLLSGERKFPIQTMLLRWRQQLLKEGKLFILYQLLFLLYF